MTGMTLTLGESRRMSSMSISRSLGDQLHRGVIWAFVSSRVTGRVDEVEQRMDPVVPEPWISLDPRFFRQDIIILPFKVCRNLLETAWSVSRAK